MNVIAPPHPETSHTWRKMHEKPQFPPDFSQKKHGFQPDRATNKHGDHGGKMKLIPVGCGYHMNGEFNSPKVRT